jgi:hypothetical protein
MYALPPPAHDLAAAAPQDVYAKGQPRGNMFVKALLVQLDICNNGIASPDWDVSARQDS